MFSELIGLGKKSVKLYNQEGLSSLFDKLLSKLNSKMLLYPYFPPFLINYKCKLFKFGYRDKYIYNNASPIVMPEPSDTVIEAGVDQGYDTAMFGKLANRVIGFEPSPRNYTAARNNLKRFDNVELVNKGLWEENSMLEIQYGKRSGDDGFLQPDSGKQEASERVPVDSLEEFVKQRDIEEVNFLKIEAEGAEPEILDGMGELRPEKIVINADEERDGESPSKQIMDHLQPKGYNLVAVSFGCVLFFVLNTEYHYAFRPEYR